MDDTCEQQPLIVAVMSSDDYDTPTRVVNEALGPTSTAKNSVKNSLHSLFK